MLLLYNVAGAPASVDGRRPAKGGGVPDSRPGLPKNPPRCRESAATQGSGAGQRATNVEGRAPTDLAPMREPRMRSVRRQAREGEGRTLQSGGRCYSLPRRQLQLPPLPQHQLSAHAPPRTKLEAGAATACDA